MTDEKLVTILTPVYNGQQYLTGFIEAIEAQTYKNWELVIVDDGSTDDTLTECLRWAQTDQRICVLTQENRGPAKARNVGLEKASGVYLVCADIDDIVHPKALELLVKSMESLQSDLTMGDFITHDGRRPVKNGHKARFLYEGDRLWTGAEIVDSIYQWLHFPVGDSLFIYVWAKLFRLDLIRQYKLSFNESIRNYEDITFNIAYLGHAKKMNYIHTFVYTYTVKPGVTTTARTEYTHPFSYRVALDVAQQYLETNDIPTREVLITKHFADASFSISLIVRQFLLGETILQQLRTMWHKYTYIRRMTANTEVAESMAIYKAHAGASKAIPFFMRRNIPIGVFLACYLIRWKRYGFLK